MPSYTIHLAIAKEFLRKNEGYNEEEFLKGTIAPDMTENKARTHFARSSSESNWGKFLDFYSLDKGFYSGWFLHLITDRLFFEEYLDDWENREDAVGEKLYDDYDVLNKTIIEKYGVPIVEEVKVYMKPIEDYTLNYINKDTLYDFIEEVSNIKLEEYANRVKNHVRM